MLKLSQIGAADTATLELKDGADEPLRKADGQPVTITIYGPGSKPFVAAKSAQQARMIAKLQAKRPSDESAEAKARNEAEFLASITHSDDGLDIEGLTEGLTGAAKYRAIYGCSEVGYIAEQVNRFAGDWANFSRGSAKS